MFTSGNIFKRHSYLSYQVRYILYEKGYTNYMRNRLKAMIAIAVCTCLLQGCGTPKQANDLQNTHSIEVGDKEKKAKSNIRLMEKKLTYTINGEEKEETAFLKESDNQYFSLYVLENYEFTAEEPRKDMLFSKDDSSIFMRMELLNNTVNMKEQEKNAILQVQALHHDVQKVTPPQGEKWLTNAKIYTAEKANEKVTAYLIPHHNTIIKLTIFTKLDNDHTDAFLKMAETIEKKVRSSSVGGSSRPIH